jgi:hypothetical protein
MSTEPNTTNENIDAQALWRLAQTDRADLVESVLASGVDVNASNAYGTTALMLAAANGRLRMVRALLKHGADPNSLRNDKFTPLLLASFFGHEAIVKVLVEYGADTAAATRFGTSAQMWASSRTYADLVNYLHKPRGRKEATEVRTVEESKPPDSSISNEQSGIAPTNTGAEMELSAAVAIQLQEEFERVPELALYAQPQRRSFVAYAFATSLLIVAAVVGLSVRRSTPVQQVISQTPQPGMPVVEERAAVATSAQTVSTTTAAAPDPEKLPVKVDLNPDQSDKQSKPKVVVRDVASNQDTASPKMPAETPLGNDETSTAPSVWTDLQTNKLTPVKTATAKTQAPASSETQPVSAESKRVKTIEPATSQLITPSKNSGLKGKVIQWP